MLRITLSFQFMRPDSRFGDRYNPIALFSLLRIIDLPDPEAQIPQREIYIRSRPKDFFKILQLHVSISYDLEASCAKRQKALAHQLS